MTAVDLLANVGSWVTRRKDAIEIIDEALVRRRMSVDYELPASVTEIETTAGGQKVYYAPLFFLPKGSDELPPPGPELIEPEPHFAAFDLRDATDRAMSLPPRYWNATISIQALEIVIERAATEHNVGIPPAHWRYLRVLLRVICRSERNEAVGILHELKTRPDLPQPFADLRNLVDLEHDEILSWLLDACSQSSIAMVPLVGDEARQGIVKLAFNAQNAVLSDPGRIKALIRAAGARIGWTGYELWIDTPFIGAETHHVEVSAPPGLQIYDAGLIDVSEEVPDDPPRDYANQVSWVSGKASEVHLYAPEAREKRRALTWVRLRVRRQEFLAVAVMASILVSVALWVAYGASEQIKQSPRGVPELLLLFPGTIAAYAARPPRHRLTSRMLVVARGLLLLVSLMPYLAAGSLALAEHKRDLIVSNSFRRPLEIFAIIASIGTVGLLLAWALPQPKITWQRLQRTLGIDIAQALPSGERLKHWYLRYEKPVWLIAFALVLTIAILATTLWR